MMGETTVNGLLWELPDQLLLTEPTLACYILEAVACPSLSARTLRALALDLNSLLSHC